MRISGVERREKPDETGVFLATAHPAKFKETVEECIGLTIEIPKDYQPLCVAKNNLTFFQPISICLKKTLFNVS